MKKTLAIILWLIAIALWMQDYQLLTNQLSIPEPYRSLYEEVLAPVVKITTSQGIGSGVIISSEDGKTYILTAAHVVGDENEVQVTFYSYRRDAEFAEILKATVIITDTIKDLALLHTPPSDTESSGRGCFFRGGRTCNPSQEGNNSPLTRGGWGCVAKLAPRNYKPYLFTEIWAVGCSLGLNPRPSSGHITAITTPSFPLNKGGLRGLFPLNKGGLKGDVWEISAPILPGNSGGGVFLKDTHRLIGITVWVRVYHGQLVTTMAGVVPLQDIYNFLEECGATIPLGVLTVLPLVAGRSLSWKGCRSVAGIVPINQIYEFLKTTPLMNCDEHKSEGLTSWSGRWKGCRLLSRGTGGPTLLKKGGEKVMPPEITVSHVRLMVAYPAEAVARVITKWTKRLKEEAPAMYEKIQLRIPTMVKFQERLAEVSSKGYQDFVNPAFISKGGTCADQITSNQAANLMRSYDKWMKKLAHLYETVEGVEAKRFKELVDAMESTYASGIANRTIPFTGTKIEGRGPAVIAPLWLVDDGRVLDMLRGGDEIIQGGPKRICRLEDMPAFKAALQGRLIQAGATIVKGNYQADVIAKENDRSNQIADMFKDAVTLHIAPFSTGGDSHVDYIMNKAKELFLDVKVAVTP